MTETVLHVGCGGATLPDWLSEFAEVRLDINPDCQPDIVAPMTDLGDIGPFDRVYCAHALEHLYEHDVTKALREFHRVLKPGGAVHIFVPDLEDVQPTDEVLFVAEAGPITGRDLYYGFAPYVAQTEFMAHKTGFVRATLEAALRAAGFGRTGLARLGSHNLYAAAVKD